MAIDVTELQREISKIQDEIGSLRRVNDSIKDGINVINGRKALIIQEENQLRQAFEKQLETIKAKKSEQQNQIWSLEEKINQNRMSLEERQKMLAKLLEKAQEQQFLDELEKTIQSYLATIVMWVEAADFQKQDILEIFRAYKSGQNGFAIFNDMGTGKTLTAIMALQLIICDFEIEHGRKPRVLWATKKSLIIPTMKEFQMWLPGHNIFPLNYETMTAQERTMMFSVAMQIGSTIITNYESINTTPELAATDFDIVIVDEVHKLKGGANPKPTKIWKNYRNLLRKTKFMIFLSGTPMVNHPKEMWAYLHLFDPETFNSLRNFEHMFGSWSSELQAPIISADKLLTGALKGRCVRRRRDEVGIQLPDLIHTYRFLTKSPEEQKVYDEMRDHFWTWMGSHDDKVMLSANSILPQLNRLRMINVWAPAVKKVVDGREYKIEMYNSAKIDECMDIIRELLNQGEQVLVFSTFNEPLHEVIRRCNKIASVKDEDTGESESPVRSALITGEHSTIGADEKFQNKEIDVLCINMFMGEGLNLQKNPGRWPGGANNAIMLDLWWSPAKNQQAEARIHRKGQTHNCQIHILYCEDSIDGFIAKKLEDKEAQFASILERNEIRPASEWKALLKGLI